MVQCQDGTLHAFDLPASVESPPEPEWPSYGFDGGNSQGRHVGRGQTGLRSALAPTSTRIVRVSPVPAVGSQSLELEVTHPGILRVEVFDVAGRAVRTRYRDRMEPERLVLNWDGNNDQGNGW